MANTSDQDNRLGLVNMAFECSVHDIYDPQFDSDSENQSQHTMEIEMIGQQVSKKKLKLPNLENQELQEAHKPQISIQDSEVDFDRNSFWQDSDDDDIWVEQNVSGNLFSAETRSNKQNGKESIINTKIATNPKSNLFKFRKSYSLTLKSKSINSAFCAKNNHNPRLNRFQRNTQTKRNFSFQDLAPYQYHKTQINKNSLYNKDNHLTKNLNHMSHSKKVYEEVAFLYNKVKKMFSDYYDIEFIDQVYSLRNLTGNRNKNPKKLESTSNPENLSPSKSTANPILRNQSQTKREGISSDLRNTSKLSKTDSQATQSLLNSQLMKIEKSQKDFSVISKVTQQEGCLGDSLVNLLEQIGGGMSESKNKRSRFKKRRGISASSSLGGNLSDIGVDFAASRVRKFEDHRIEMEQIQELEAENRRRRETAKLNDQHLCNDSTFNQRQDHQAENSLPHTENSTNDYKYKKLAKGGLRDSLKRVVTSLTHLDNNDNNTNQQRKYDHDINQFKEGGNIEIINAINLSRSIPVEALIQQFSQKTDPQDLVENLKNIATSLPPDYYTNNQDSQTSNSLKKSTQPENLESELNNALTQPEFIKFLKTQNLGQLSDVEDLEKQLGLVENLKQIYQSQISQSSNATQPINSQKSKKEEIKNRKAIRQNKISDLDLNKQNERFETEFSDEASKSNNITDSQQKILREYMMKTEKKQDEVENKSEGKNILVSGLSKDTDYLEINLKNAPQREKKRAESDTDPDTFEKEIKNKCLDQEIEYHSQPSKKYKQNKNQKGKFY